MRLNKTILILLCINVFILAVWLGRYVTNQYKASKAEERSLDMAASAYERDKLLTKNDYLKLEELGKRVMKAGTIPDADFAWLLQIAEPTFRSGDYRMPNVRAKITARILDTKNLSASQKDQAFRYMTRLFDVKSSGPVPLDSIYAVALARKLQDKRSVPYLLPLTKNPNKQLRGSATATLKQYGVNAN